MKFRSRVRPVRAIRLWQDSGGMWHTEDWPGYIVTRPKWMQELERVGRIRFEEKSVVLENTHSALFAAAGDWVLLREDGVLVSLSDETFREQYEPRPKKVGPWCRHHHCPFCD